MAGYWAVVPAAGIGHRMGGPVPKQYLMLAGKTVLQHTLDSLTGYSRISGVVVATVPGDPLWDSIPKDYTKPVLRVDGGGHRGDSVLNALFRLEQETGPDDFVLVHDAVRPCLRHEDLDRLVETVGDDPAGGILARPAHDTMKRGDADCLIIATEERRYLWHAMTPQMFPLGRLTVALAEAREQGQAVTDEASAMERTGLRPQLVAGHADNIKITRPEDLTLAEFFLRAQGRI